jgi:FAD-dependent oxidoreductase domain-containing protein 1
LARTRETVAIVGGAIVGSATAWFLRELGFAGEVIVIERDPSYRYSSTALSAASIRTQFACAVNIHMSLFGAAFLRDVHRHLGADAEIGLVERGYLVLGTPETAAARRACAAMQIAEGAAIEVLTPSEAGTRFPWLRTDDLAIATTASRNEGWFDAWALLSAFRRAARGRGVTYIVAQATEFAVKGGRAQGVVLADGTLVPADWCVNAAGPASGALVRGLGIDLPVGPRKRTVFVIRAPLANTGFPMVFDTSGAWIRPEGEGFICGIAPDAAHDPDAAGDFEPDHGLMESTLWPALAHRIPALEQLRVERAWAGHYEVNALDHNGVIGLHDEIPNLIFATGFSGHGLQHAPATGRGVAELITGGRFEAIDLSPLGYGRIRSHTPIVESIVY